mmetsp:Transcript_12712/g.33330  ORF Transcript_12712/g.33330 Transcript_12712/m.33330 type:complete len:204 (+) Transcript_12712:531-1142(+)
MMRKPMKVLFATSDCEMARSKHWSRQPGLHGLSMHLPVHAGSSGAFSSREKYSTSIVLRSTTPLFSVACSTGANDLPSRASEPVGSTAPASSRIVGITSTIAITCGTLAPAGIPGPLMANGTRMVCSYIWCFPCMTRNSPRFHPWSELTMRNVFLTTPPACSVSCTPSSTSSAESSICKRCTNVLLVAAAAEGLMGGSFAMSQ